MWSAPHAALCQRAQQLELLDNCSVAHKNGCAALLAEQCIVARVARLACAGLLEVQVCSLCTASIQAQAEEVQHEDGKSVRDQQLWACE